uniref:HEPN domain-containing protein n=1 Tax=uncultured bacterium CSLF42 TaxID=1091574 RepID=G4WVZ8_9BACT|nr:HEPN domain-containing protein [uncultured bacterium CSLF42]
MKSKEKVKLSTSGAEAWLRFAEDDERVAALVLKDGPWNMVCFHAQQGSEKCLKAFLRARTGDVPRVHSLAKLIELCGKVDRSFLRLKNHALSLDRYYIPTRYPEAAPGALPEGLPNRHDAQSALADLRRLAKYVRKQLSRQTKGPLI